MHASSLIQKITVSAQNVRPQLLDKGLKTDTSLPECIASDALLQYGQACSVAVICSQC